MHIVPDVLGRACDADGAITPIHLIAEADCAERLAAAGPVAQSYAQMHDFTAKAGQVLVSPAEGGGIGRVLAGLGPGATFEPMALRSLPTKLRSGDYRIETGPNGLDLGSVALAFALGSYGFDRYKAEKDKPRPRLVVYDDVDLAALRRPACAT